MVKTLAKKDVVLFGEQHNSAIAHWLQLELTKKLNETRTLELGAEMIEADNQDALDLYLTDSLNQRGLDTSARLWPNYRTDYAPLIDFAKSTHLSFTATNIPRRYASMVYRGGFETLDTLSEEEKSWIAPLPIPFDANLPTYQSILKMMGPHGTPLLVMSQATKDATMAHFTLENWEKGKQVLHFNGSFHSDRHEGIIWYINEYSKEEIDIKTFTTVEQANIEQLDKAHLGKADFIIVVPEDMTKTY